jgi:hypothetical protein
MIISALPSVAESFMKFLPMKIITVGVCFGLLEKYIGPVGKREGQ